MNITRFFVLPETMAIRNSYGHSVDTALGEHVPCDNEHTLMVSIVGQNDSPISFCHERPYLRLHRAYFDDVDTGTPGAISKADADNIAVAVLKTVKNGDFRNIIVHCAAGISRSAGVCAALEKFLTGDDSRIFNSAFYHPNMTCYNAVLGALTDVTTK